MAAKTPVKAIYTGSDVTSLGEYTSTDTVAVANLGTGTPSSSTYLRGDGAWSTVSSNSTSSGLYEHANTISANYTIGTGNNALTAGPITINTGVSVTVPTGSTWVVS